MTDRAEIERLLNKTGRTLEGLPTQDEYWYSDDYAVRNKEVEAMMFGSGFEVSKLYVLHQFDVIELLVGALRDALDKPMQKPLTYDEVIDSDSPVWAESSIAGVLDDWFYPFAGDDKEVELLTYDVNEGWIKSKMLYNKTWRAWASRPTDEERRAASWEN